MSACAYVIVSISWRESAEAARISHTVHALACRSLHRKVHLFQGRQSSIPWLVLVAFVQKLYGVGDQGICCSTAPQPAGGLI